MVLARDLRTQHVRRSRRTGGGRMIHDIAIGLWPYWQRMAFMAALALIAGGNATPYLAQLETCAVDGAKQGES